MIACKLCRSKQCNGKNCQIISIIKKYAPRKVDTHFMGSSPPAIFVGNYNYPHVYAGILAPSFHDELSFSYDSPEEWFKQGLSIEEILRKRSEMIYSRFVSLVSVRTKLVEVMQEVSLSSKICDVEFYLKEKPKLQMSISHFRPPIGNPASLQKAIITGNVKVHHDVDKTVSDTDLKAVHAVLDLYRSRIPVTTISKLLTAGLLGVEKRRKLTPTRWAITAVDDTLSKDLIKKIKQYPLISEYYVFSGEYLGNHYEILLMPSAWGFEVIERDSAGRTWQDHESFLGRKDYAESVTGAYYANRLAVGEYLTKIQRQACAIVFREIKDTYWAPCGVGILREVTRAAFEKNPMIFPTEHEALAEIKKRMDITACTQQSVLLKERKEQLLLHRFI